MKKSTFKLMRIVIAFCCLLIAFKSNLFAQKLLQKQIVGITVPADMKIDGKATEWNNQFQAYNNKIEVFYSLANDDVNLYLVIKAVDPLVIRKIVAGGISFKALVQTDKKNKFEVDLVYPFFSKQNRLNINLSNIQAQGKKSALSDKKLDSLSSVFNNQITSKLKKFKILGISSLPDTIESIYNEDDIKVASAFDDKLAYVYEMQIPLRYLHLSNGEKSVFDYQIIINGSDSFEGVKTQEIEGGTLTTFASNNHPSSSDINFIRFPTDVSGKYTLFKKQ